MTSIEQDIVQWAATRPAWQQNIIARVARDGAVDQGYVDEVTKAIIDGSVELTITPLNLVDLQGSTNAGPKVDLTSVGNVCNINALTPAQTLTFGPTGLTVIYGDNGSGKSGYARLIKDMVGARHRETVLPDAYATSAASNLQSADVTYSVDGAAVPGTWPDTDDARLRQIHFYDEACGNDYLASESEMSYRPSVLGLFDSLIDVTDRIRASVDLVVMSTGQAKAPLPVLTAGTKAHSFLSGLSVSTTAQQVEDNTNLGVDFAEQLAAFLQEEARLKSTDPNKEKLRLSAASGQLLALANHFDLIQDTLSVKAAEKIVALQKTAQELRQAAELASASDFATEPLQGVGTESWRALWLAAQKYSEEQAYIGREFPASHDGDTCVLCQQPLSVDGRGRMTRFQQFVQNETARNAEEAEERFKTGLLGLKEMVVSTTDTTAALVFLTVDDVDLAKLVKLALETAQSGKERIVSRLRSETDKPFVPMAALSANLIRTLAASVAERSMAIDENEFRKQLSGITAKKTELSDLALLSKSKGLLVAEIARLIENARLQKIRGLLGTGPMTTKSSELTRTYVTAAVSDRFARESERLLLEHVVLGDRGGAKGKLRHQPALLGAPGGNLPSEVLSEGEQTALGLAGLFTEIYFDASKSAVVLDDPVSSLDHNRRKKTAQRIVGIAMDRQVIVFTHDLTFLGELVSAADALNVPLTERSIERNGVKTPGFVLETYPWKAKDSRKRLGDLQTQIARVRKAQPDITADEYERMTSDWGGSLSETWERLVRSEVVNKVVDRGTTEVRPKMFRLLARITAEDDLDFQTGYGEASEWARRHDKSEESNYTPPTIEDMQTELDRTTAWHKRMIDYAK